jgi:hypothetical protein
MSVLSPGGVLGTALPPAPAPAPAAGTGSVALTPTPVKHHRKLSVRIVMKWHWDYRRTRLVRVKIGRTPAHAAFSITCRGKGCPAHKLHANSATLRRRHRTLGGKLYRADDRLLITLSAPGWTAERARITIRNGREPAVQLL